MAGQYPGAGSGTLATFVYPYGMPADVTRGGSIGASLTSLTLWTPATGNKFRLLGVFLSVSGGAVQTTAGEILVTLEDGGTLIPGCSWYTYVGAAAGSFNTILANLRLNGGYLSSAINNVLSLNLGTALTGGHINATVYGLEES